MSHRLLIGVILSFGAAGITACRANDSTSANRTEQPLTTTAARQPATVACAAPHVEPKYVRPADDSVALASLIEGAGSGNVVSGGGTDGEWEDVAAGNLCGGAEKELVLVRNAPGSFSVMRGPTPFLVRASAFVSDAQNPWSAVAAGNLDADPFDEIVAVRHVTRAGVPDLIVAKADSQCAFSAVFAQTTIGNPGNSLWQDIAIGNFDGKGKKIVLLKLEHTNFFLVELSGRSLNVVGFS